MVRITKYIGSFRLTSKHQDSRFKPSGIYTLPGASNKKSRSIKLQDFGEI
jgi:hypothetical protein